MENHWGITWNFHIDTLFAGHPDYIAEGRTIKYKFISEDYPNSIPFIDEMVVGQRYFIRGWENVLGKTFNVYDNWFEIKPLDDKQLWYIQLGDGESIDISDPALASIKNQIDILNENLHTQWIYTTADMSAMPQMQESARVYYLLEGRWLTHQDHLDANRVIVIPEELASMNDLQLGDELEFTFRSLTDTYYGTYSGWGGCGKLEELPHLPGYFYHRRYLCQDKWQCRDHLHTRE